MLFNSIEYLLVFLPAALIIYFMINRRKLTLLAKGWLIAASLFFYGWWDAKYLTVIIASILFNYSCGFVMLRLRSSGLKFKMLILGIAGNVGLLGYFKYSDFIINNMNSVFNTQMSPLHLIIPLGISFFTFTQIAYLVDVYRGMVVEYSFANYSLFVTFFPHLLAGPIIHHREMMPQFDRKRSKILNYDNLAAGLFLLCAGLFKKVVLADSFAEMANKGFAGGPLLSFGQAWTASLSYTFQIYFDFSGYTDMALGSSLMFNIRLPINFNSPYKAQDIRDFWRRWHMTLSRFLKEYVYIPLGGSRGGELVMYCNLLMTFLVGGIWHGAGWTFVVWGALHGAAVILHRVWQKFDLRLPNILAWFLTFNFINITWVFFRAPDMKNAVDIITAMFDVSRIDLVSVLEYFPGYEKTLAAIIGSGTLQPVILYLLLIGLTVSLMRKNSNELVAGFKPGWVNLTVIVAATVVSLTLLNRTTEFLYFNF